MYSYLERLLQNDFIDTFCEIRLVGYEFETVRVRELDASLEEGGASMEARLRRSRRSRSHLHSRCRLRGGALALALADASMEASGAEARARAMAPRHTAGV